MTSNACWRTSSPKGESWQSATSGRHTDVCVLVFTARVSGCRRSCRGRPDRSQPRSGCSPRLRGRPAPVRPAATRRPTTCVASPTFPRSVARRSSAGSAAETHRKAFTSSRCALQRKSGSRLSARSPRKPAGGRRPSCGQPECWPRLLNCSAHGRLPGRAAGRGRDLAGVSGFDADRALAGPRSPNPDGLYTPVQRNVVLWTSLRTVSCPVPRVRSACGQTS